MDGPSILVPFDGSAASRPALAHAVDLAARRWGRVTLLGVVPDLPLGIGGAFFVPPLLCALELESELGRFIEGAVDDVQGRVPVSGVIRRGRWRDEVLARVAVARHDLVVVGARRGRSRAGSGARSRGSPPAAPFPSSCSPRARRRGLAEAAEVLGVCGLRRRPAQWEVTQKQRDHEGARCERDRPNQHAVQSVCVGAGSGSVQPVGAGNCVPYATWEYSWIRPPSRSRRRTRTFAPDAGGRGRPEGGLCCSARCARCEL